MICYHCNKETEKRVSSDGLDRCAPCGKPYFNQPEAFYYAPTGFESRRHENSERARDEIRRHMRRLDDEFARKHGIVSPDCTPHKVLCNSESPNESPSIVTSE